MVAKITVGHSLYGALAYNGEKVNEEKGRLIAVHKIFDDGTGKLDIRRANDDFMRLLPEHMRTKNPVVHISLNPHPDDRLGDEELRTIAEDYLSRLGYGSQPYVVFRHDDISRSHLHIVTLSVDEQGKRIGDSFLFRHSAQITRALESKYGLHTMERRSSQQMPLRKANTAAGDVKRQVGNIVKELGRRYRFQSMGEYRALLSLFNVAAEEVRGEANGRAYCGIVYSATDDAGTKVGTPFKSSLFGKSAGYEALQAHFKRSARDLADKKPHRRTKRAVLDALGRTHHRENFTALLKEQGIDVVLRQTETGRIYGATFIDHDTGCVVNGSRMGKELSANALQEHFTLPYAGLPAMPHTIAADTPDAGQTRSPDTQQESSDALGLFSFEAQGTDPQEEAVAREMLRRKKKKRKGRKI